LKNLRCLEVAILAILMGCATATKNMVGADALPDDEYSIVFGSVADYGLFGKGIQFKNKDTGEKSDVGGAKGVFILKLKPGTYFISARGIHGGGSVPCQTEGAVEFKVPSKSLVYAGSTFSDLQSDKYYYDLKGLEKNKTQGPFEYCKVNPLTGNPVKHMSYKVFVYNNLEMDQKNLFQESPQLKSWDVQNSIAK
jgi:hypothetical protein